MHHKTYNEVLRPNQYRLHVTQEKPEPRYTPPTPEIPTTPSSNTTPMTTPTVPASPTNLAKTYETIDKEQFKEPAPIVIETSGVPAVAEVIDPLDAIPAAPVPVQEPVAQPPEPVKESEATAA